MISSSSNSLCLADPSVSVETDELVRSLTEIQAVLDQLPRAEIDQQRLILDSHRQLRMLTRRLIGFLESNKPRLDAGALLSFHLAAAREGSVDRVTQEAARLLVPHLEELGYSVLCTSVLGGPWRLYIRRATLSADSSIKKQTIFLLELRLRLQSSMDVVFDILSMGL